MFDLEVVESTAAATTAEVSTGDRAVKRDVASAIALAPVRLFLAAGWLRAVAEKLLDPAWWNGEVLAQFVAEQRDHALSFFSPVLTGIVLPNAVVVSVLVVICQLLVGIGLVVGHRLQLTLRLAILMNLVFVLAGRVNPSVFYLVLEMTLLYAISAGLLGAKSDRATVPPLVMAAGWTLIALTLSRWVETIEPEGVIEDPAMVLVMLCVILASTAVFTAATSTNYLARLADGKVSRAAERWVLCRK